MYIEQSFCGFARDDSAMKKKFFNIKISNSGNPKANPIHVIATAYANEGQTSKLSSSDAQKFPRLPYIFLENTPTPDISDPGIYFYKKGEQTFALLRNYCGFEKKINLNEIFETLFYEKFDWENRKISSDFQSYVLGKMLPEKNLKTDESSSSLKPFFRKIGEEYFFVAAEVFEQEPNFSQVEEIIEQKKQNPESFPDVEYCDSESEVKIVFKKKHKIDIKKKVSKAGFIKLLLDNFINFQDDMVDTEFSSALTNFFKDFIEQKPDFFDWTIQEVGPEIGFSYLSIEEKRTGQAYFPKSYEQIRESTSDEAAVICSLLEIDFNSHNFKVEAEDGDTEKYSVSLSSKDFEKLINSDASASSENSQSVVSAEPQLIPPLGTVIVDSGHADQQAVLANSVEPNPLYIGPARPDPSDSPQDAPKEVTKSPEDRLPNVDLLASNSSGNSNPVRSGATDTPPTSSEPLGATHTFPNIQSLPGALPFAAGEGKVDLINVEWIQQPLCFFTETKAGLYFYISVSRASGEKTPMLALVNTEDERIIESLDDLLKSFVRGMATDFLEEYGLCERNPVEVFVQRLKILYKDFNSDSDFFDHAVLVIEADNTGTFLPPCSLQVLTKNSLEPSHIGKKNLLEKKTFYQLSSCDSGIKLWRYESGKFKEVSADFSGLPELLKKIDLSKLENSKFIENYITLYQNIRFPLWFAKTIVEKNNSFFLANTKKLIIRGNRPVPEFPALLVVLGTSVAIACFAVIGFLAAISTLPISAALPLSVIGGLGLIFALAQTANYFDKLYTGGATLSAFKDFFCWGSGGREALPISPPKPSG